ncbi:MAG: hypothetical protein AAF721_12360 [Myxococcota bacterium]
MFARHAKPALREAARVALVASLLAACGQDDSRAELTAGADAATGGGIDPEDGGGVDKLDIGGTSAADGDGGDASAADGCKKVDLLFVIDNSGSMADEQANLVASFPGFIGGIQAQLADTDGYHVGVITSDLYTDFDELECLTEGLLVTQTHGEGSSNRDCAPFASGGRYMTEADDLGEAFSCAAQVGIGGEGNERPMQTMVTAISEGMTGPGGCNEGFLRDDALLVVVVITDEEDDHEAMGCPSGSGVNEEPASGSNGEPAGWFNALVAAKGGSESNVVVLSLVGPREGAGCPELAKCAGGVDGAEVADRIIDFTEMFTFGIVGPVCQPYAPFFAEAIGHIKSACDDFIPVG